MLEGNYSMSSFTNNSNKTFKNSQIKIFFLLINIPLHITPFSVTGICLIHHVYMKTKIPFVTMQQYHPL